LKSTVLPVFFIAFSWLDDEEPYQAYISYTAQMSLVFVSAVFLAVKLWVGWIARKFRTWCDYNAGGGGLAVAELFPA
jgi:hypothetical protein